jgi:hypothetical protein
MRRSMRRPIVERLYAVKSLPVRVRSVTRISSSAARV